MLAASRRGDDKARVGLAASPLGRSISVPPGRLFCALAEVAVASRQTARYRLRSLGPAFELDRPHDPILLRDDQTVRRGEVFGKTRIAGEGGLALFHIGQVRKPP